MNDIDVGCLTTGYIIGALAISIGAGHWWGKPVGLMVFGGLAILCAVVGAILCVLSERRPGR